MAPDRWFLEAISGGKELMTAELFIVLQMAFQIAHRLVRAMPHGCYCSGDVPCYALQ